MTAPSFIYPTPAAQAPSFYYFLGRNSFFYIWNHPVEVLTGTKYRRVCNRGGCSNVFGGYVYTPASPLYGAGLASAYPPANQWLGPVVTGPFNHVCVAGMSSNGGDLRSISIRMGCAGSYDGGGSPSAVLRMSSTGYVPLPQGWPYDSTGWVPTGAVTRPNWNGSVQWEQVEANVTCNGYACTVQILPVGNGSNGTTNLTTFYINRVRG